MKINLKEETENLTIEDLSVGDVVELEVAVIHDTFVAMYVETSSDEYLYVDFSDGRAYSDLENYKIVRKLNVELREV